MQNNIRTLFAFVLSILLVFSLAACSNDIETDGGKESENASESVSSSVPSQPPTEPPAKPYVPESAIELWNKIDGAMDALTSVESTMVAKVTYYYMGYEFKMDSTMLSVSTKDAAYLQSDSKIACADVDMEQTVRTISAYYDGKMYIANNDGTYDQKLCSAATKEEYSDSIGGALTDEVDISDCTGAKFAKNADGTWTVEFSGYTNKTMNKFLDSMGMASDMLGAAIEDMKVTVIAGEDFLAKTMTIAMVFEEEEGAALPEYSITAEYSKYDAATFDPAVLKAEEYTEVTDLFILDKIEDGIKERQNATSGHFVLDLTTTTRYYGQTSKSKETDIVTYGKKNNAFYYSINIDMTGTGNRALVAYQNGIQTSTFDGKTYTTPSSDADAKTLIDGLIDSAMFNALAVTNIEKDGDGVYMLTLENIDLATYNARVAEQGVKFSSGEQTIKVTFEDGKLVKIESVVSLEGKREYNDIEMELKSVVDFEKEADYPTF